LADVKEKEPTPPPKQTGCSRDSDVVGGGEHDPYPSIRIPPDISSQKATRGSSLQIGRATRALSRSILKKPSARALKEL